MKLYDYQKTSVEFSIKNEYAILALECGLGKSIVALTAGVETKSKILIVSPAYLKLTWQNEINKWYPDLKAKIISYNAIDKSEKLFEWADLVIADECQNLKNPKAKRTELFHRFVFENSIKRVLLLTGTPVSNKVWDFYSLISICNYNPKLQKPEFLKQFPSYVDFADHFSYRKEYGIMRNNRRFNVVTWEGFKNVDQLRPYLKDIYIKFRAKDVLKDLPDKIYKEILISESEDIELLNEFNNNSDIEDLVISKRKAMSALTKVDFTIQYVKDLMESGVEKVLVYTDHVDSAHALAKGLGVVRAITGSMPMKDRQAITEAFQTGKLCLIVATIGSYSTGVTLTSCSNTVYNDISWKYSDKIQTEARTNRIGQLNKCVYHYLFGSITDARISKLLLQKAEIIKNVT